MIKPFLLTLSAISSIAGPAFSNTVGQMPTLKPNACGFSVKTPAGLTNRIYFSRDCQTIYVTPREVGKLSFSNPLKTGSATPEICQAVKKRETRLKYLSDLMDLTEEKTAKLRDKYEDASPEQALRIEKLMSLYENDTTKFRKELEKGWDPFDKWPAARIQVFFETGLQQDVDLFREENKGLTGISIQAAPISDGAIYFTPSKNPSSTYTGVLSIEVPGKKIQSNSAGSIELNSVYMNGGISGLAELSVPMVCDLLSNPNDITKTDFSPLIVGNYVYQINAEVGHRISASASITAEELGKFVDKEIIKTKFTRQELINQVYTGSLSSQLQISIDDGGSTQIGRGGQIFKENEEGKSLSSLVLAKVLSTFFNNIEAKLLKLEIIEKIETPTLKDMEPGSETVQSGTIQVCQSNSSLFGLIKSNHCRQQVIYRTLNYAGKSSGRSNIVDNQSMNYRIDILEKESIPVIHTMTFGKNN
ncbi:MAG TPA: hypothetical protein PLJ21_01845 [Pseudobdellovibrionaceae bacterium]|nr:hypothetical protein [Pseudobdellovibrionaceae bacterium]